MSDGSGVSASVWGRSRSGALSPDYDDREARSLPPSYENIPARCASLMSHRHKKGLLVVEVEGSPILV